MSYKVGIVCASDDELAPFLRYIKKTKVTVKALLTVYEGEISGVSVAVLYSGVCRVNVAVAVQILIDTFNVNAVINAGTAGGLDSSISVFDIVIGNEFAYWDLEEDILTEFHPWLDTIWFQADSKLLELAKHAAGKIDNRVHIGRMVTGEKFVSNEKRNEIINKFNPLTVDMETAGAAHVCYVNRIPFIAIRSVTDIADCGSETDFETNCAKASEISADMCVAVLKEMNEN